MTSRGICLVIEDNEDIGGLMGVILTDLGFDVRFAQTGAEGVLFASGLKLALITLDVGLPDMDGRDVALRLGNLSEAPILMVTAFAHAEDQLAGMASGASAYLIKPFRPSQLRAMVQRLCPEPASTVTPPALHSPLPDDHSAHTTASHKELVKPAPNGESPPG